MDGRREPVDLLVIGGGTAGLVGARTAARLGARTVLVERARTGGDCLWTGCVPSKTLLSAAEGPDARRPGSGTATDFAAVRRRVADAIAAIEPEDSPEALEALGATVISGSARFTGPREAEINGTTIRFRQALIATGAAPILPTIPGLAAARPVTSETVWDLEELPARLVVIGGGPVACELGQAFARLGSSVTLLSRSGILRREDRDAAALVRSSLTADGVIVIEDAAVERVGAGVTGSTVHASGGRSFDADIILVAVGRGPRTAGLGLDSAGVECDDAGYVRVDASMRTSNPAIWAAGDVTPYPDFTHLAGVHASTATLNAVLGVRRTVDTTIPRVTFTSPEVAAVGQTSPSGRGSTTRTIEHAGSDRAITQQETSGFTRIVIDRRGRILGGTIVGPRAGESLAELTLAVHQKMTTRALTAVTHPYPTYNDALWNAAIAETYSRLERPIPRAALKLLVGLNRRRPRRARRDGHGD
ncbi:NAD(P)/FAD-dependent oxidoreductase [uncultured Arthrobacter sp.]|uniref:dihydrolipoyl dehydrogenase family protein n=1 Tax=uncultured Arthrobacter sp. TaxID=114050 RepID=UPI0025F9606D|nr:FAD-dependent oxidoreductase [uncultured Arthrobacter sp.]